METILKVIVGSQAHGLAGPDSDIDYRGVFVQPTTELLKIGGTTQQTSWVEGAVDDTSWEVGKFLFLATKSNPTILEVFLAPRAEQPIGELAAGWGDSLRALFPYVWSSKGVRAAFVGYGLNQRKKFLDDKDGRAAKYAVAYLRTLYCGWELLQWGTFSVDMHDTPIYERLVQWKAGNYLVGEVVQECRYWEEKVEAVFQANLHHETDLAKVNDYLLALRRAFW